MFKKGEVVKAKAVIPSGPVQALRFNDEGNIESLLMSRHLFVIGDVEQPFTYSAHSFIP